MRTRPSDDELGDGGCMVLHHDAAKTLLVTLCVCICIAFPPSTGTRKTCDSCRALPCAALRCPSF